MKTIITASLMALAMVSPIFAADSETTAEPTVRLGVDVDYNNLAMDQVNQQLSKGTNVTTIHSGVSGILNLDVKLAPFLTLGAKTGYLSAAQGSSTNNDILFTQTTTLDTAFVPLELGLGTNIPIPATPISISAGIFGGYGFASASIKNEITTLGQTASVTQPFTGSGFIGDLALAVNIQLVSALSFNLHGGYRMAKITRMVQSEDVSYNGIPFVSIPVGSKGDTLKDSDNKDLEFDYSGYHAGAGLSLSF